MNSKDSCRDIEEFFEAPLTGKQKAWGLINKFYHLVLTRMEAKRISRSDLSRQLNRSKASVSQMFNKSPNISVMKMVEIAEAVGMELDIVDKEQQRVLEEKKEAHTVTFITIVDTYDEAGPEPRYSGVSPGESGARPGYTEIMKQSSKERFEIYDS